MAAIRAIHMAANTFGADVTLPRKRVWWSRRRIVLKHRVHFKRPVFGKQLEMVTVVPPRHRSCEGARKRRIRRRRDASAEAPKANQAFVTPRGPLCGAVDRIENLLDNRTYVRL
jgi:hypothetical protein